MRARLPGAGRALVAALWALAALAAAAQNEPFQAVASAPVQDTRSALGAEREAQTQVLDAAERACYARFFTSNCLLDVARSRRAMQADIKQREAALNAADRHQRAQDAHLRLQEKLQLQTDRLQEIDPLAIEQAEREKRDAQEAKQREHAAKAAAPASAASATPSAATAVPATQPALPAIRAKAPKADSGPSAQERAANQAAFDKKQLDAQRRMAERDAERAKAAASGASAAASLPLPPPAPPVQ